MTMQQREAIQPTQVKSHFRKDIENEAELGRLLDNKVYPKIYTDKLIRINGDTEKGLKYQKKGVDFALKTAEGDITYFDEKAQLNYINRPLDTFAFECSLISNNMLKDGWFLNKALLTDKYNLIYPKIDKRFVIGNQVTSDEYTELTIETIDKRELQKYIEDTYGLSFYKIKKEVRDIRFSSKNTKFFEIEGTEDLYFVFSKQLAEKPINLVINRKVFTKLPSYTQHIIQLDKGELL